MHNQSLTDKFIFKVCYLVILTDAHTLFLSLLFQAPFHTLFFLAVPSFNLWLYFSFGGRDKMQSLPINSPSDLATDGQAAYNIFKSQPVSECSFNIVLLPPGQL